MSRKIDIDKEVEKIVSVIKRHRVMYVNHIFAHYGGMSRAHFYESNLDKLDTIKQELEKNRCKAKSYMLDKWVASDNPTLQIAAYRMIGDDEERERLIQTKVDLTSAGKQVAPLIRVEVIERQNEVRGDGEGNDCKDHEDIS